MAHIIYRPSSTGMISFSGCSALKLITANWSDRTVSIRFFFLNNRQNNKLFANRGRGNNINQIRWRAGANYVRWPKQRLQPYPNAHDDVDDDGPEQILRASKQNGRFGAHILRSILSGTHTHTHTNARLRACETLPPINTPEKCAVFASACTARV